MGMKAHLPVEERKQLFLKTAKERGNFEEIEMIGEFSRVDDKTDFLCKRCGIVFKTRPAYFYKRRCCPNCNLVRQNKTAMSLEKFQQNIKLRGNAPNIEVLEFTDRSHPCKVICRKCGNEFEIKNPTNLYYNDCCKKKDIEKRQNIFLNKVKNTDNFRNIELIGQYINQKSDTQFYCKQCDTTFFTKPLSFYTTRACPVCNPLVRKQLSGELNKIYNSNKEMYNLLLNKADGKKYAEQSTVKLKWVCPNCNSIIYQTPISVYQNGLSCKSCGDGISYPNKVFFNMFKQLKIDFIPEKTFEWAKTAYNRSYFYDFYLPKNNIIIEVMGIQHYKESSLFGDLRKIKKNDIIKEELANKNGISKYVKIDCSYSNIDFIKESILSSSLSNIIDYNNVDWLKIDVLSNKSMLIKCCEMYDKFETYTPKDIAKELPVGLDTITSYLKRGSLVGICSYSKEKCSVRTHKNSRKDIDQYDLNGVYIKTFHGICEAERELEIKGITDVLRCKIKTKGGYIWKYSNRKEVL